MHPPAIPLAFSETQGISLDLLPRIPGLFRLLDLVSDGHTETIITDHDSMGAAMNTLRGGSYKTISKIDFAALDGVSIKPVGLYGSKSALTETLMMLEVVGESLAEHLRQPINRDSQLLPYLRSGIYLLLPPIPASNAQAPSLAVIYVIYWPEDETWNDDAPPTVQKNRVFFMRYLTKLAQDIRPLISEEHAAAFVWKYDNEKTRGAATSDSGSDDGLDDDDDRFVKFEVKQSSHEDKGVQQYPGFTFIHPFLGYSNPQSAIASPAHGETSQAFMLSRMHEEGTHEKKFNGPANGNWLRTELRKDHNVYLGAGITEEVVQTLFDLGAMKSEASQIYHSYKTRKKEIEPKFLEKKNAALSKLQPQWPILKKHAELLARQRFSEVYNTLHTISSKLTSEIKDSLEYLTQLSVGVPKARTALERYCGQETPTKINSHEYNSLKDRFIDVAEVLHGFVPITEEAQSLIDSIVSPDESRARSRRTNTHVFGSGRPTSDRPRFARSSLGQDDVGFLRALEQYGSQSAYRDVVQAIKNAATHRIESLIWETSNEAAGALQNLLESFSTQEALKSYCEEEFCTVMGDLCRALVPYPSKPFGIRLDDLQPIASSSPNLKFAVKGSTFTFAPAFVEHSMTQLHARREEIDLLEHDPSRIPSLSSHRTPVIRSTPLNWRVLHVQLIDQGRRILHIIESSNGIDIFLNNPRDTEFGKSRKHFPSRKDRSLFFAVDEQTCQLAVVYLDQQRSFFQAFFMDEHFEALQPRGPQYELTNLYDKGPPEIQDICFFSGIDGICILEKSGKIRVFSPQTQAFWPGSIKVSSIPVMMRAAPDGSALLLVERIQDGIGWQLRVYHQATFTENQDGIVLLLPPEFNDAIDQSFTVSSLGQRKHIFLIAHTPSKSRIISIALRISRSESHWSFRRKQLRSFEAQGVTTKHNSIVDCFAEVWERFPVVPAISRDFTASRPPPSLTFVTYSEHNDLDRIPHYFISMVQDFTRQSHKPTGRHLRHIDVRTVCSRDIRWYHSDLKPCKAGEWFVELISLIPVRIAFARDNRFLLYKDGIPREAIQQEILGREVADMIDIINLGPYEAILGSYMATRPVKVVSAMGEQSVGKSFSLNHLLDTSFVGSAMRTTEGVWLSLCPTKDQVVIALDFEGELTLPLCMSLSSYLAVPGVHSLERTEQEDMLLVLFNAAISNLVMFRNNFALNRNVSNMFTSFQASACLFDPVKNPNLFKGLLAIIIKDVVDADKKEIVEEFSSKFNQMVNTEQGENFITVLHDNQLAVMPWDVIRSKEFYTRFSKLRKYLFKQRSTHNNAGEFLLTLKTLMAKITAQDWGAIDQTLIRHRTSILQALLEQALISGQGDVGSFGELEGFKNYDTQQALGGNDTDAIFYLGTDENGRQGRLTDLLTRLGSDPARSDVDHVKSNLQEMGMRRIAHVKAWMDSNVSRFMPTDNSDIKALKRKFDELSTILLANIQRLMSLASMTAGLRIDASNRVLSAHLRNIGIRERVGCRLSMMASTCDLAASMTSEVVKRLASSQSSILVNMSALQTSINVESLANFKALISTTGDHFHVPMSAGSHSTNTMTLTAVEKSALAQFGANSVHGIAPWVTTFMGSKPEQLICASHAQIEHDTAHGSMQKTVWAIEESGDSTINTEIHRFRAKESGVSQLCSMYCRPFGRHAHIDFCRNDPGYCQEAESEHSRERILPDADFPKDWISHRLFWVRTGFKDPYSRADRDEFALCDHHCPGNFAGPSYCTLPIFHSPPIEADMSDPSQYVSSDGHLFNCRNPAMLSPLFHVIFVLDRSWSMLEQDCQPLRDQPIARRIASHNDNRFGAVLSAFYQFLLERSSAPKRDAYSVIVFNGSTEIKMTHDTTSSIDQMVENLLRIKPTGGTNFRRALVTTRQVMEESWSADRSPVVIFLSDGEGCSEREAMTELCHRAVALGYEWIIHMSSDVLPSTPILYLHTRKALSFWSISFGPHSGSLQEMADIAKETAIRVARGSGVSPVPCDFHTAINTVQLADVFSSIATSLGKTPTSLINPAAPAYARSDAPKYAQVLL
ncbi:hypothetical protein M407DRAFT_31571 [Tulasnella calospora MUT 4182]|uniref:VWFA domain-containing protein n=1 Tax=Tulasnella calospora MUT 4182 TaxID=1051891 RepID=A0A0C3Q681_9AGAM|nr:hypothetical protein M407DRAFT_31571 [Tulasnella calospora MUT 4182]